MTLLPTIKLPDLDVDLGDLRNPFKTNSDSIVSNLTKLTLDVNVKTDIKAQLEPLILSLFNELQSLLKDITFAANELLDKSKQMATDLIKQVLTGLEKLASEVGQIVSNLLKEAEALAEKLIDKLKNDLVNPFFDRVDNLRQALVEDIRKLINEAITQVKDGVTEIIYKGDKIITGTVSELTDELKRFYLEVETLAPIILDPDKRRERERHKACKDELDIEGVSLPSIGSGKFFDYLECRELKRLDENTPIKNIKTSYGDLQNRAWKLACVGRTEGSALQDKATKAWLKYGQLYYLWNEFEDDMTPLEALEKRIQQLDNQIATFQAKSLQIDNLSEAVQKAQATADTANTTASTAVSLANTAQATANTANTTASTAVSLANTAQATANTSDATANTAVSLANTAEANANTALLLAQQVDNKTHAISRASDGGTWIAAGANYTLAIQTDGNIVRYKNGTTEAKSLLD